MLLPPAKPLSLARSLPPAHTACALREVLPARDALCAFEGLRRSAYAWLLDSALPSQRLGRYSFAGADPYLVLRAWGTRLEIESRRSVRPGLGAGRRRFDGDPFEALRALLPRLDEPASPQLPFVGGAVGYLGYELAARLERVEFHGRDDLGVPDLVLLFVDRLLAWDNAEQRLYACALGFGEDAARARARAEAAADALAREVAGPDADPTLAAPAVVGPRRACFDEAGYAKAVDAVLEEIAAGNVYQVCLTHRIEQDWRGDPWQLYRDLRRRNPAPFASFFELPELAIASSSPERFLRLRGDGRVESRPIKGTRPRGRDPAEDAALRRALATSAKDRAENLMIVDLVRNDLGRVCATGSVEVPELMAIEEYAAVFQMVSTVAGRLRPEYDVVDLVKAAFPPGSMTGAPKIAALRILDRLEPVRRGVYAGAIGYFDAGGGADLSVAIRSVLLRDGRAWVHTGGGIVADSDPRAEYRESLDKAAPLLAALSCSTPRRIRR